MKESQFPPGPRFAIGAYVAFYRDPLDFLCCAARRYGDFVHLQFGTHHDYLVNHPDYVKAVLLAGEEEMLRSVHRPLKLLVGKGLLGSQGEFHRSQRRLIHAFFQKEKMSLYSHAVTELAGHLRDRWRDGQIFDVTDEMMHLTMAIIARVLFSVDIGDKAPEIARDFEAIVTMTNQAGVPLHSNGKLHRARARLDDFLSRLIEERRATNLDQPGFLSELLKLQGFFGATAGLSDQQIRDEAMTMFVAGHETIASQLAWTWYLLSQHPEVERRLHRELDCTLAGRTPTLDDLPSLPYANMVLSESMRLYPPVWIMTRRAVNDFPLGDYVIPAGSYIHICQYVMHRNPRYFPNPERFDPLRWTPEECAARPKFCYFPFGAGSRRCVGEHFAAREAMLVLAILAQSWRLELVSGPIGKPQPLVTLRPSRGMMMSLLRRRPAEIPASASVAHA